MTGKAILRCLKPDETGLDLPEHDTKGACGPAEDDLPSARLITAVIGAFKQLHVQWFHIPLIYVKFHVPQTSNIPRNDVGCRELH